MAILKKKLRIFLTIFLFFVGIFLNFLITNAVVRKNITIPADLLLFINWDKTLDGYISEIDPQIIIPSNGYIGYLQYLTIKCDITGDLHPQIYYNSIINGNFSQMKSFYSSYKYQDGVLTIPINVLASRLRIDLGDGAGITLTNLDVVEYQYGFMVNILGLLYTAFFLTIMLGFANFFQNFPYTIMKNLKVFNKYSYLLINLVRKDITIKYRRSILGILWSVLNPLLMMLVITSVFKNIFKIQIENFPVYYLTGSLIFNFMSEATTGSMMSVLSGGGLIRKVYIPKYIFPLEKCMFALVNCLFSFVAVLVMIPVLRSPLYWTLLFSWIPLLFVLIFSFGLGMILSSLTVFFRDINHLYTVWIVAWMYLTPIIYPVEILPQRLMFIMEINPMYHYVDYFRQLAMEGVFPSLEATMNCFIYSIIFLAFGIVIFKKTQDRFILYI